MLMIHNLSDIAKTLNDMRRRRGALDFDFPEYKVLLDTEARHCASYVATGH